MSTFKTTRLPLALFGLAAVAGCGAGTDLDDPTATGSGPLTGSIEVTGDFEPFDAVVRYNSSFCTATKIGARRFLTAAHCMDGFTPGTTISMSMKADQSDVNTYTISRVDQHPSWELRNVVAVYDEAIFEITVDTPSIRALGIRTARVADGQTGLIVGHGCDSTGPNSWKKQAAFAQAGPFENTTGNYTHNVMITSDRVALCPGDSGGPILVQASSGAWEVGGVNSWIDNQPPALTHSAIARTGNVRGWIAAPGRNDFTIGSVGTFLNGDSALCMGVDGNSTASGAHVSQFWCDGRDFPSDNQYWRLRADGAGGFRFVNTRSNLCMGLDGTGLANGDRVAQFACDASSTTATKQSWRFVRTSGNFYQVRNSRSGKCVGISGGSNANGGMAAQFGCSALGSINNQSWELSR